jgi:hypothetical protein
MNVNSLSSDAPLSFVVLSVAIRLMLKHELYNRNEVDLTQNLHKQTGHSPAIEPRFLVFYCVLCKGNLKQTKSIREQKPSRFTLCPFKRSELPLTSFNHEDVCATLSLAWKERLGSLRWRAVILWIDPGSDQRAGDPSRQWQGVRLRHDITPR